MTGIATAHAFLTWKFPRTAYELHNSDSDDWAFERLTKDTLGASGADYIRTKGLDRGCLARKGHEKFLRVRVQTSGGARTPSMVVT